MTDELIEKLTAMAGNMGTMIAGAPDEMMAPSLNAFRQALHEMLTDSGVIPAAANLAVEAFMMSVKKIKHEIEAAIGTKGVTLQ